MKPEAWLISGSSGKHRAPVPQARGDIWWEQYCGREGENLTITGKALFRASGPGKVYEGRVTRAAPCKQEEGPGENSLSLGTGSHIRLERELQG